MKVIIPVAGLGKRLQPHTLYQPKPLLQVADRAILDYVLQPLCDLPVDELILVIGYKGEQIKKHVDKNYSFNTRYVQQDKLLGLGYAVSLAMQEVNSGPVLVVLGDTIVSCDMKEFVSKSKYVLGLREVRDPERFGIAQIKDSVVTSLVEKPSDPIGNLALIGLYYFDDYVVLKNALANHVQSGKLTRGEVQFTDALSDMIDNGIKFVPFKVGNWYDCGTERTLLEANQHFLKGFSYDQNESGNKIIDPVYISKDAKVSGSTIGPHVSIGKGARIENTVLSNSLIFEDARVTDSQLENSIIGQGAVVEDESGTINRGKKEK